MITTSTTRLLSGSSSEEATSSLSFGIWLARLIAGGSSSNEDSIKDTSALKWLVKSSASKQSRPPEFRGILSHVGFDVLKPLESRNKQRKTAVKKKAVSLETFQGLGSSGTFVTALGNSSRMAFSM
ncbi:MAG: hypothetical protein ACRERE_39160 [Candidatus Entotheonellia bacterium]